MKKILALLTVSAMLLAFASCGETAETSSAPASSTAPVSSSAPVSIVPVATPTPAPAGPANLALDGTAFDMNEGLTRGDDGWMDYYERDTQTTTLADLVNDGNTSAPGWQPMGTDGEEYPAVPVTYNNDKKEGFYEEEGVKMYNLHEGNTEIPENWYFSNDESTEIRESATYKDGTAYVGVRFDEIVKTDCIVLEWENAARALSAEDGGYYLEYTADGEKWEKLDAAIAREDVEGANTTDTAEFEALEVKGVRVVVLRCATKWGTKLFELEVYKAEEAEEVSSVEETAAE